MVNFSRDSIKKALAAPMADVAIICRYMGITYKTYCERFRTNGWTFNQKCDLGRVFHALTGQELKVLTGGKK